MLMTLCAFTTMAATVYYLDSDNKNISSVHDIIFGFT